MKQNLRILYLAYGIPKPNLPQGMFIYNRIKELVNQKVDVIPVTTSNLYSVSLTKNNLFLILKNWGRSYNFNDMGLDLNLNVINIRKIEYPHYYINLFFFNNIFKIKNIYQLNKCNLIHAHFVKDGLYAYWLKKKYNIPYVLTSHAYDITIVPHRNKILRDLTVNILENSKRTIFVSKTILEKAKELGYSGHNAVVIPNGYDPTYFYRSNNQKEKNNIIVGFVGRLTKLKRADCLPEIFLKVKNRISNVKLYIVGDGKLKDEIISRLDKYNLSNDAVLFGHINHQKLAEVYNKLDVLILPSIHEGFPTVIMEALACGVPVVASDAEGNAEAVKNCGIIVPQGENFIERFSNSVVKMIESPIPYEDILNVSKEFTWTNIISREIEIYKSVIKN